MQIFEIDCKLSVRPKEPGKYVFSDPKRLLQHYLPKADINCRDRDVHSPAEPESDRQVFAKSSTCCARSSHAGPKPTASQSTKSSEHLRPTECANYFRNSAYAQSETHH